MKRIHLLLLFCVLLIAQPVSAEFNSRLGYYGLPKDAISTNFRQVSSYSFTEPGSAIVQVWHSIPYGTIINEYYDLGGYQINARFHCENTWFTTTCNYHLSGGGQSSDVNESWVKIGVLGFENIDTTIANDNNGTIWFAIAQHAFIDNYGMENNARITFPALNSVPITSLRGTASAPIQLTVQTLVLDEYSTFVSSDRLNQSKVEANARDTIAGIQTLVMGIVGIITLVSDHPILIFAYLEIFALMFSLNSKDMVQWWKNFIKIHSSIVEFIFNNAQAVIGALAVVFVVGGVAKLLGAG